MECKKLDQTFYLPPGIFDDIEPLSPATQEWVTALAKIRIESHLYNMMGFYIRPYWLVWSCVLHEWVRIAPFDSK